MSCQTWQASRLDAKRQQLLGHLALLRAPDSLFCIPPLHPIRVKLRAIVYDPSFERFINGCIFLSSITLALERPGIGPVERWFLDLCNTFLNGIFLLECILKIIVLSFWAYLADKWNRMDMSIVFIAYVDEIVTRTGADVGTGALKVRLSLSFFLSLFLSLHRHGHFLYIWFWLGAPHMHACMHAYTYIYEHRHM